MSGVVVIVGGGCVVIVGGGCVVVVGIQCMHSWCIGCIVGSRAYGYARKLRVYGELSTQ